MKTLFQKIIDREIPAKRAHEDELCIAIHDVNPQAPVHVLIIPKKLIPRVGEATPADQPLLGHLVINNGRDGGESVPHLHVHLLGQRPLAWPPG